MQLSKSNLQIMISNLQRQVEHEKTVSSNYERLVKAFEDSNINKVENE